MGVPRAGDVAEKCIFSITRRIFRFYLDGFRAMVLGRTLWGIIVIKLVVLFGIVKLFFFPDFLATNFTSDTERAEHVLHEITVAHVAHDDFVNKDGNYPVEPQPR